MKELIEKIRSHQYLYYVKHQPEISDFDFDSLLAELQALEKSYPNLVEKNSPTRLIGSDLTNDFSKFQHTYPVLSLTNLYSFSETVSWAYKIADTLQEDNTAAEQASFIFPNGNLRMNIQWKIDGASLLLYYEKGELKNAVTRGTGLVGDNVTSNALTIRSIPHVLKKPVNLIARGEVYMKYSDFQIINEGREENFANPRNLAAGTLKHKKSKETASRSLLWAAFDGLFYKEMVEETFDSREDILKKMEELGLPLVPDMECVFLPELESTLQKFEKQKELIDFPVDGLVVKFDSLEICHSLGSTSISPRWAIASKFKPEIKQTKILDIEFSVGRTGKITPRAFLEPVQLAGTTVNYATLHNEDYINEKGVRIGSIVEISKRGDIIPAVERVIETGDSPPCIFPKQCPSCQTKLTRSEKAADWMCLNIDCKERKISRIIFFAGRKQMDISGLGEKIIRDLYENSLLQSIPDMYRLSSNSLKIEALDGFGKKSTSLLLEGIEESKKRPFSRLLYSLGLEEIGPHVSMLLMQSGYHSYQEILNLVSLPNAQEKLIEIDGIGPQIADSILQEFSSPKTKSLFQELQQEGLNLKEVRGLQKNSVSEVSQSLIFKGQKWCITGSFKRFQPRELAIEEIQNRGGKVLSSVSTKTTSVLAGEDSEGSSKYRKAKELNIPIISEQEFLAIIQPKEEEDNKKSVNYSENGKNDGNDENDDDEKIAEKLSRQDMRE